MRNLITKLSGYILLGILVFSTISGASANFFSYAVGNSTGQSNARYEADKEAKEKGIVTCQPQDNSSANLWTCKDAYGNQFTDLRITKVTKKDTK
jgi:hypothetical protein